MSMIGGGEIIAQRMFAGMCDAEVPARAAIQQMSEGIGESNRPIEVLVLVGAIATSYELHRGQRMTYGEWAEQVLRYINERGYKIVPEDDR